MLIVDTERKDRVTTGLHLYSRNGLYKCRVEVDGNFPCVWSFCFCTVILCNVQSHLQYIDIIWKGSYFYETPMYIVNHIKFVTDKYNFNGKKSRNLNILN